MRTTILAAVVFFGCDSGGDAKSIYDFVPETYDLSVHPAAVQECIASGLAFNARAEECGGQGQAALAEQLEAWEAGCREDGMPSPGFSACGPVWANGTCAQVEAACCVMWTREHECSMIDRCEDAEAQGRPTSRLCEDLGF